MQIKTVLIAILAVLSAVLVGVSAYHRSIQPEISPIVVKQPIINQSVATSSDETANWNIYSTIEGGFEMKYPKDWNFYKHPNSFAFDRISTFSKKQFEDYIKEEMYVGKPEEENYGIVTIGYGGSSPKRGSEVIEGLVEGLKKSGVYNVENYNSEILERDNLNGYRVYYSGKSYYVYIDEGTPKVPSFGIESVDVIYFVSDKNQENNRVLKIEGVFRGKNAKEYSEIFDQILSTLKFIK